MNHGRDARATLRNQSQLFSQLHCLGSAPGAQLVEQAAGMGLDGVFADKEFFGDLAIAQAVGNQLEDLQLARINAELGQSLLVQSKELRRRHFSDDDRFLVLSEFKSEPDTQHCEKQRDQSPVDFDGMLDDQEAILDQLRDVAFASEDSSFQESLPRQILSSYPLKADQTRSVE